MLRHVLLLIAGSLRRSSSGVEPPDPEVKPRAGKLPGDAHVQLRIYCQEACCEPLDDAWRLVGGRSHHLAKLLVESLNHRHPPGARDVEAPAADGVQPATREGRRS